MIRFCLHPGHMRSVNDGDLHFISARQLAHLYGVQLHECVVLDERAGRVPGMTDDSLQRLLHLYPSPQGAAYRRISDAERRQYPLPEPAR